MAGHPFPEKLELYERLVATLENVQRKGKANPYTSLNGHMFSFLSKEGEIAIRFSKEEQEAFMEKHNAGPSIQYGSVMRGYVTVPEDMLARFDELAAYLKKSYEYIASLEPKPTTKKKK